MEVSEKNIHADIRVHDIILHSKANQCAWFLGKWHSDRQTVLCFLNTLI